MSRTRTLIAWLVVIGLHLVPCNVYAQDAGPGREIGAIRHDLPILLVSELHRINADPRSLKVDDVLVVDDHALVQWHDAGASEIAIMAKRLGVWWLLHEIWIGGHGEAMCCGGLMSPGDSRGPATSYIKDLPDVPVSLADRASQYLSLVATADERPAWNCGRPPSTPAPDGKFFVCPGFHGDGWCTMELSLKHSTWWACVGAAYSVTTAFAVNDATDDAGIDTPLARPPTEAESWLTQGGNAYFYFSGTLKSPSTVHVSSGTTIDVWFPFVLDTSKTYSLTIAHATPIVGPIDGTLKDNTLRFVLPAFAIDPGATIMGEIDGDPLDNP